MGTNTQTAEPRVQVTGHRVAPCPELPAGFYAAKISAASQAMAKTVGGNNIDIMGVKTLIVDAAKIPQLILDLQAVQIELATQAIADTAVDTSPISDEELMRRLETEETVTLSGPAFSGEITRAIAASGNYRHIWEVLDKADDPTWDQLTDSELRAIINDYRHTAPRDHHELWQVHQFTAEVLEHEPRHMLEKIAKMIFVGRASTIEEAAPEVDAAALARMKNPTPAPPEA